MPSSFIKRLKDQIFHQKLFSRGDGIVVGISGGPDSTGLVRALKIIQKGYEIKLALLHINYGLRGRDSEQDEIFVKELAEELKLDLRVVRFNKVKKTKEKNLEQAMREFRYGELEKERKRLKMDWIAVAHTLDDQAETFLMNLLRGSGMKGLGAIPEKKGRVIRPLLFFSKQEIIDFLVELGQSYRIDQSNLDDSLFRNKIRLQLLPLLEKKYNPRVKFQLANLSAYLREGNELIEEIIGKKYNEYVIKESGCLKVSVKKIGKISEATRRMLFRKIVEEIRGDLKDISSGNFFEFEKIVKSSKSKTQILKVKEVVIKRRGDELTFCITTIK